MPAFFVLGDFEDYAALCGDPEVMHHLGGPWDRGRSWRHLAFLLGHWQLGRPGMWALEQKETGAFLGMAGFSEPEGWPGFELAGRLCGAKRPSRPFRARLCLERAGQLMCR